jgi:transposase
MQTVTTIGLDIAKSVFQVHGVDADGQVVIRRRLKCRQVIAFFQKLLPCLVGIEAMIIRSKSKICFLRLSSWLANAATHARTTSGTRLSFGCDEASGRFAARETWLARTAYWLW